MARFYRKMSDTQKTLAEAVLEQADVKVDDTLTLDYQGPDEETYRIVGVLIDQMLCVYLLVATSGAELLTITAGQWEKLKDKEMEATKAHDTTVQRLRVRNWMLNELDDKYGPKWEVVNLTELAENAASEFDIYEGSQCDIPEWVFEVAFDVVESTT